MPTDGPRIDEALLAWLHQGRFLPGSRLPPLRRLARDLRCSLHGVHQAVLALERSGRLVRRSPHIFTVAGTAPAPDDLRDGLVVFTAVDCLPPPRAVYTGCVPRVFAGMVRAAGAAGLRLHTFPPDPATLGRFEHLVRQRPLGWVFMQDGFQGDAGRRLLAAANASGLPVAVYGDALSDQEWDDAPWDAVAADHRQGAIDLVRHLAAGGAQRLLPVLGPRWGDRRLPRFRQRGFVQRLRGYAEGAREAGVALLGPEPYLADPAPGSPQDFAEAVMQLGGVIAPAVLAAAPAAALLGWEDGAAMALGAAARRLGRDLPAAGYDATWAQRPEAAWAPPPAITIDQGWEAIGAALVELALERRRRPDARSARRMLPGRLTAPSRTGSPSVPHPSA